MHSLTGSFVLEGAGHVVSRLLSRVISALDGVTLLITLLITNLLSPLPLQVVPCPNLLEPLLWVRVVVLRSVFL